MKTIIRTLVIASLAVSAVSAFANNWQWTLDQIKADQQRCAKRTAAEHAKLNPAKPETAKLKAVEPDRKPASNPPAK